MPDTDLAEAKRVAYGLQSATRMLGLVPDFTGCGGPAAEAYWEYFTPARISSLLAAAEAALKLHQPVDRGTGPQCKGCATHITFTQWPCPTYRAIAAALIAA